MPTRATAPCRASALALITVTGLLISAYLTYLELFALRAICQWCVVSAVLVVAFLVLGALRLKDDGSDILEMAGGR